jgi:hypothetical protein
VASVRQGEILSRNKFVAYQDSEIIGRATVDDKASRAAKKHNQTIDNRLSEERQEWILVPPSNMTLTMKEVAGEVPSGLVLSVPHEVGRVIVHKRLVAGVIEHDVSIDAVIDGELEEAFAALGLGREETN